METGTGKTYVYLRTIFELSQNFGFQKFIIVVPSVAIREGVLKNIDITSEHFRALYNSLSFEHFVYDARSVNRLRQFATSNTLQLLIINIDAFRKNFTGSDAEQKSNVIYKENDKLSGRQPIEFVQSARPIVIIDEPQSVDSTERSQEAIKALNPLCTLRYSATHRNVYNLVYRLDPVRAFELGLVKQVVVASAMPASTTADALVRVEEVEHRNGIKAKLRIHVQTAAGPKERVVSVRQGTDLFSASNERAEYAQGYSVAEISAEPGSEIVRLSSGRSLGLGEQIGGLRKEIWRTQIRYTIRRHLEKELQVRGAGIKVLSLFFVDRVANYRSYDESGVSVKGKFAVAFEEELARLARDERYRDIPWLGEAVERLHNGYFAADRKGMLKDTRGDSQPDDEAYNLIMRDKERLLSLEEPLRFLFSHSALREGWDNPNVFQICTLNETSSVVKKRQEIGRGLRLPVNQRGERVFDDSVNRLYVMANESYEEFAKGLQREYEEDCGVIFGRVPLTAFANLTVAAGESETAVGRAAAEEVQAALLSQGFVDSQGRIQATFRPGDVGFTLELPGELNALAPQVCDLLSSYQIERHIRRERDDGPNRFRKEVALTAEFLELWSLIKSKTTYRVEFETPKLVVRAAESIRRMASVSKLTVVVRAGQIDVKKGGVDTSTVSVAADEVDQRLWAVPDLLAYLQDETDLTRSTIVEILRKSGRLSDFFNDPQTFLDAVAAIIKHEVRRLLVDGIKYERVDGRDSGGEWEMVLFKNEEIVNYLTALPVSKSVYEYVCFDSDVERRFARQLDEREDIKLFMKLPRWFEIDTPVGKYNPDWAIVKEDPQTLYLVRETKGTKDFLKLRTSEADKVRCGKRHFDALGVSFGVAVTADEV